MSEPKKNKPLRGRKKVAVDYVRALKDYEWHGKGGAAVDGPALTVRETVLAMLSCILTTGFLHDTVKLFDYVKAVFDDLRERSLPVTDDIKSHILSGECFMTTSRHPSEGSLGLGVFDSDLMLANGMADRFREVMAYAEKNSHRSGDDKDCCKLYERLASMFTGRQPFTHGTFNALKEYGRYFSVKFKVREKPVQTPFRLDAEAPSDKTGTLIDRFQRDGGDVVLESFLKRSGIDHGNWSFKISSGFAASAGTVEIQVRKPEKLAVALRVRPGSSKTGFSGLLYLPKPYEHSPLAVYQRLHRVAENEKAGLQEEPEVVPPAPLLDDEETVRLLMAVHACNNQAWQGWTGMEDFVSSVASQDVVHGLPGSVSSVDSLEFLTGKGLLVKHKVCYTLTDAGRAMALPPEPAPPPVEPPPTAATTVKPAPSVAVSPPPTPAEPSREPVYVPPTVEDPVSLILKSKDKLQALLAMPLKLSTIKARQAEIDKKVASINEAINKMQAQLVIHADELERCREEEKQLVAGVDVNALAALLQK